ncbi:TRAP transporter small permease [uncultured Oscillibacter sp.]|uniref:TRAP transporter small permease n=1 Tax=uncultured Oscillibacter sp. TaxID=876091 RepID=UPI002603B791|nr:TRAP transporter small permease [uncultured Oscillibacter sp.]
MKKFKGFFDGLSNFLIQISCILLLSCAAFVNIAVFLRYLFHLSFQWTEEVARYLHISVVILLCGPLLWSGGHISMDLLLLKLKGAPRKIVRILGEIVTLVLVGYTFYMSIPYVLSLKATGILTFSTKFEQWMPTVVIPIGFLFATLFCIALIIREIAEFRKEDAADESLKEEIAEILDTNQLEQIDVHKLEAEEEK